MTQEQLFDVTLPLSGRIVLYPGDQPPVLTRLSAIGAGDPLNASHLSINCHVGTHLDTPRHFLDQGATLEQYGLDHFYGPATVLGLEGIPILAESHLRRLEIPFDHHLILKTDNSSRLADSAEFVADYSHLLPEAASHLSRFRPRSVGFDYYSLDPFSTTDFPAHLILAKANVPVFVCLNLAGVRPGRYTFVGLPLRLEGAEASPARVMLIKTVS